MANRPVDADAFGSELSSILGVMADVVVDGVKPAVKEGAKVARDEWRDKAPRRTGAYAKSISYRVTGNGADVSAEIGSATLPGLPHLLEKGHAKVGGGRVAGIPHIAPAAEDAFDATEDAFERLVDKALSEAAS